MNSPGILLRQLRHAEIPDPLACLRLPAGSAIAFAFFVIYRKRFAVHLLHGTARRGILSSPAHTYWESLVMHHAQ
jgi:hypothetical protein